MQPAADLRAAAMEALPATTRWNISVVSTDRATEIRAEHPASAGMGLVLPFDVVGIDADLAPHLVGWLTDPEFAVADAAPDLEHGEQATLARMIDLWAAGRLLRKIAAALDAERRPPRRGVLWHSAQIGRVLRRLPLTTAA